jgi:hypothetical protein
VSSGGQADFDTFALALIIALTTSLSVGAVPVLRKLLDDHATKRYFFAGLERPRNSLGQNLRPYIITRSSDTDSECEPRSVGRWRVLELVSCASDHAKREGFLD